MPGIAVIGAQWGDEGKGKIAHLLSQDAEMAVRFNGGTNAGHTVVVSQGRKAKGTEVEFKFHLIPSGAIRHDCVGVLGGGMVIEPFALAEEVVQLQQALGSRPKIYISQNAHLILPYHTILERLEGSKVEIGTTARGIGPAYQDKVARRGLRMGDLLRPKRFGERLRGNVERLRALYPESRELKDLEPEPLAERVLEATAEVQSAIVDTVEVIHRALDRGQTVIFEGAQGTLLDVDFGTYPYVTSSHATVGGVGVGAGISPRRLERVVGVLKAYTTRVGAGPFPTEETGEVGEKLRGTGANPWDEFGTTTGRPRRCGWLDLVALEYAVRINDFTDLALVKLDVLSQFKELKVATAYRYQGELLEGFPTDAEVLGGCEPVYEMLPGWSKGIRRCRSWRELPADARRYVRFIETTVGVPVSILSVGRASDETIWLL
jgi:adenylosuccinate synthase